MLLTLPIHVQWLQQTLWERHGIETRRLSLAEMLSQLELRDRQQPAAVTVTGAKAAAVAATTSTAALVADVPGRAAGAGAGAAAGGGGGGGGDRHMGIGGRELVFKACGTKVGLVYFRAGYTPTDYPTEAEWQVGCVGCPLEKLHTHMHLYVAAAAAAAAHCSNELWHCNCACTGAHAGGVELCGQVP
jgi:Eukaryotic glutathione synthase